MTRPRILLVDDDTALLEALPETLRLRADGIEVDICDSAPGALKLIEETDYDVIISDIKMPGMDGLALLAEIKERRPDTPTLLITGHGERDLAVAALRGGAHDLVQKPIDRDYFVATLERAIQLRKLDRQVAAQHQALERHARVLDHVGDGVFLVDAEGIVQLWNPAAEAITGLAIEAVVGRPVDEVIPGWMALEPLLPVAESPGAPTRASEAIPVDLGGREVWLSISVVRFADGTVYAFRDLTAERAIDDLKREFLATASHELRTPLSAIYGAAMTLRRRDLDLDDDGRQQLLNVIAQESDRLARIVKEILVADHLDSGRLRTTPAQLDPIDSAASVVEAARIYAPPGIAIELDAPDGVRSVAADPDHLRQVLVNLVDNAVKYSPDGGHVTVRIEDRGGSVRFAVSDEGLGIPSNEQTRIFDKFYRLDPGLNRGVGGTGLGLYICRELVRRMDGRISVASTPGRGSTFAVDLPVATVSEGPSGPEEIRPSAFPQAL
ncbi:MAG TPA: ATP-binding protein [Gaiellaceae bacterium]|nr:ATP-binding protein [Gaiellaceae bacterium]